MNPETSSTTVIRPRRMRVDADKAEPFRRDRMMPAAAVVAVIACFVLIGAGNLDLGPTEARLGLAAGDPIGPFGRVYGAWEPGLLPGRVFPCRIWHLGYGGVVAAVAAVRWPQAIAAALLGVLAARRMGRMLGARASILAALTLCGSIAWIDRSGVGLGVLDSVLGWLVFQWTGIDTLLRNPIIPDLHLIAGLGSVLAIDRMLTRRADVWAGVLMGLAFLAGGWPSAVVVMLPMVVLGHRGFGMTGRAAAGLLAVVAGWSVWALATTHVEAWAAAMALPLTKPPAWTFVLWAFVYALPWSPLAALAGSKAVREGWSEPARSSVMSWLQVVGVMAMAGTLVPGLADAARVPALFGLAIASAAVLDRLLEAWAKLPQPIRRAFWAVAVVVTVGWAAVGTPLFGYLAAAVGYYRTISIVLVGLGLLAPLVVLSGLSRSRPMMGLAALIVVAGLLKLAHWGVYVPEWNYRMSQGPWGRAIGQWMPRRSTLYFINSSAFDETMPTRDRWPADLAFATGRRVRQLPSPAALEFEPRGMNPHFVLLHPAEFEHWPPTAPPLVLVRELRDQHDQPRILARTEGPLYPDRRKELGE